MSHLIRLRLIALCNQIIIICKINSKLCLFAHKKVHEGNMTNDSEFVVADKISIKKFQKRHAVADTVLKDHLF